MIHSQKNATLVFKKNQHITPLVMTVTLDLFVIFLQKSKGTELRVEQNRRNFYL